MIRLFLIVQTFLWFFAFIGMTMAEEYQIGESVTVDVGARVNNMALCDYDRQFCVVDGQITTDYNVEE